MSDATDKLVTETFGDLGPRARAALRTLADTLLAAVADVSALNGPFYTETVVANFDAVKNTRYIVDLDDLDATLPTSPASGDCIWFVGTSSVTSKLNLLPGALNIMAAAGNVAITTLPFAFGICYSNGAEGWLYIDSNGALP